jgi:hypothetical protein
MVFRQGVRAVARVSRPAALAGAQRLAAAKGVQARALAVSASELSSILEDRIKACRLAGAACARAVRARRRAFCVLTLRALCLVALSSLLVFCFCFCCAASPRLGGSLALALFRSRCFARSQQRFSACRALVSLFSSLALDRPEGLD